MARPYADQQRDAEIISLFRSGLTTTALAPRYGITATGIATVLKRHGIDRNEGGKAVTGRINAQTRVEDSSMRRLERLAQRYDCKLSDFDTPEQMRFARRRFIEQRMRARQRRIEWVISFVEWWGIWQKSGLWNVRGREHSESAVMARRGDVGPYSNGNVYIITLSANFTESWASAPNRIHGGRLKSSRWSAA